MRNLFLKDYYLLKLDHKNNCSVDFDELSYILYVINEDKILTSYQINRENPLLFKPLTTKDLSTECENQGKVINIKFILETESLIIIFEGGDILKYQIQKEEAENVGSIENGISTALWSPNQEHLLIATNNKSLILLDVHLDLIKEVPLDEDEALIKDTDMRKERVSLVWREDSKFISTNFPTPKGRKILTRDLNLKLVISAAKADEDGVVKSVSEKPLPNLRGEIEWIPNGSLMIGVESEKEGQKIIFWEKNGLNHGEFLLPNLNESNENVEINALKCSKDSEILSILLRSGQKQYCLFYIRSNFRWYLKKVFTLKDADVSNIFWGSKSRKRLLIVYKNSFCEVLDLNLEYKSGIQDFKEEGDLGVYCSIDNRTALTTNFFKYVVPPPMCSLELKSSSYITSYCLGQNFALLINEQFFEFCFLLDEGKQIKIIRTKNLTIRNENHIRNALFLVDPKFECISDEKNEVFGDLILILNNEETPTILNLVFHYKNSEIYLKETYEHKLFHNIIGICANGSYYNNIKVAEATAFVYVQYQNGNIYKFFLRQKHDQNSFPFEKVLDITHPFNSMTVVNIDNNELIFGMTENNRLFCNSKVISTECTSFSINNGFLIFTSNSPGMYHLLFVFDITLQTSLIYNHEDNVAHLLPKPDSKSINIRNIERGSKIVKVINEKIVFQLPRGNLETIYSKILVLKKFKLLMLETKKYKQAFELLRQHKFELNLIFDINPKNFIKNYEEIIKDIEKNDYINLFLSSVSNEISEHLSYIFKPDELKEIKEYILSQSSANKNWKVNSICELTKAALEKINKDRYILSIMTTYLKKIPNEIEQCLEIIKQFKQIEASQEQKQAVPPHLNPQTHKNFQVEKKISASDILEYVCWLADPDKMYEFALGTCDLELVAMVAVQTQKDPKEYIPYLESLKKIENEIDRKVKIYTDLKKYENAVGVLALGEKRHWDLALELIQKYSLFNFGMKSFKENPEILLKIKELLGDYVLSKKDYYQAGILYLGAKNYLKALESYKANGDWKEVLHLAEILKYDESKRNSLMVEMVEYLNTMGKHSSAGLLLREMKKENEALNCFIKSNDWENIIKIDQSSSNQQELRNNVIIPHLKLTHNLKMNFLKQQKTDFKLRYERLLVVQENKKNMPLMFSGMNAPGNPMIDNETSSESSFQSKSSYMSVKSMGGTKRRQKKKKSGKKRTIKEGSLKEEDQIVDYLKDFKLSKNVFEEIEALIQSLLYFDLPELATEIYEEMKSYLVETNVKVKSLTQMAFEKENPQILELYPNNEDFKESIKTATEIESYFNKYEYLLRK